MVSSAVLAQFGQWVASPAVTIIAHRYFLSFASAMPDPSPDACYFKRLFFNFVQAAAGNESRIKTDPLP